VHSRDTTFALVSRAPLDKIEKYKAKRGWNIPWYSSFGDDFNYDFHVTIDESVAPPEYNYRTKEEWAEHGNPSLGESSEEAPGYSVFLHDGADVFHTYSMYARAAETLGGSYYFLDITPLGRQEEWEQPKGRADRERPNVPSFDT
jgi:predicted dithiol-disulfide oxidoreductase (DUF899 family)